MALWLGLLLTLPIQKCLCWCHIFSNNSFLPLSTSINVNLDQSCQKVAELWVILTRKMLLNIQALRKYKPQYWFSWQRVPSQPSISLSLQAIIYSSVSSLPFWRLVHTPSHLILLSQHPKIQDSWVSGVPIPGAKPSHATAETQIKRKHMNEQGQNSLSSALPASIHWRRNTSDIKLHLYKPLTKKDVILFSVRWQIPQRITSVDTLSRASLPNTIQ